MQLLPHNTIMEGDIFIFRATCDLTSKKSTEVTLVRPGGEAASKKQNHCVKSPQHLPD